MAQFCLEDYHLSPISKNSKSVVTLPHLEPPEHGESRLAIHIAQEDLSVGLEVFPTERTILLPMPELIPQLGNAGNATPQRGSRSRLASSSSSITRTNNFGRIAPNGAGSSRRPGTSGGSRAAQASVQNSGGGNVGDKKRKLPISSTKKGWTFVLFLYFFV